MKSGGIPDSAEQQGALLQKARLAAELTGRDMDQLIGLEEDSHRLGQPVAGPSHQFPNRTSLNFVVRPRQEKSGGARCRGQRLAEPADRQHGLNPGDIRDIQQEQIEIAMQM